MTVPTKYSARAAAMQAARPVRSGPRGSMARRGGGMITATRLAGPSASRPT